MAEEIELKFFVKDYNKTINTVLPIAKFKKSAYEITIMYDDSNKTLFKDDARLRLRRIVNLKNKEETCELSYKKPKTREGIKVEEEDEVKVSSFVEMKNILEKQGFSVVSSYERIRDTFESDDCKITVDSFPFGELLEIEGEINKIKNIAEKLGFDLKDNTTKSCDDIYADICEKEGREPNPNITFEKKGLEEKEDLRWILI
jgi:adenylate cyclase class 2